MLAGQLVVRDDRLEQLAVSHIVRQVIAGTSVDDQAIQRAPGMADLLAGLGRLMFFVQLPRQAQQLAAIACTQGIQCLAMLRACSYPVSLPEQPLH